MQSINHLERLFKKWSGEKIINISSLPESGSSRKYFRITNNNKTAIGVYNTDKRENRAFIYLTKQFLKHKLNVPKIYSQDLDNSVYLIEDIGDVTLFSLIEQNRNGNLFNGEVIELYKNILEQLPRFQITAAKKLNFNNCYPRSKFDFQSIMWDLNYFKYHFLKLAKIDFDEQKLENDFNTLTNFLLSADCNYFLYRDFNSRNIMIKNGEPYFIDYQGGRKGALQYDLASLLFDSKADLPNNLRTEFSEDYLAYVNRIKKINKKNFLKYYYGYVLIRLLQMFGAYGYRGYFEGKMHFLKSIPYAVKNLEWLLTKSKIKSTIKIPELFSALDKIVGSKELQKFKWQESPTGKLTVRINSFSYRDKIPIDFSGNGGGFVFDCRAITNPGRYEKYKSLNGTDKPVQDFLAVQPEVQLFLNETYDLIDKTVENYMERGWSDLMVNYGCTGGQHRSVYCAAKLSDHLKKKFDINVILNHTKF